MKGKVAALLLTALPVVVLDQVTKILVDSTMMLGQSITILENFFHLTYLRNRGAAFSLFAGTADSFRLPFLIGVSLLAFAVLIYLWRQLKDDETLLATAYGLVMGGAVGNLIDRVRLGEVIDFLDAHWYNAHWPAFNVADSAVCIGVALLFWDALFGKGRLKAEG
ncbi:MAG: signal peptidase II [Nitrospirota bacterium]|nr:signal peptidase II [Nitrospirota bacterium]